MTTVSDNYRFADLTLDVLRRSVARGGEPIELKALDFDLLRFLVESAPNIVNPDVLAEKVWGRHFVSPENVAQRIMLLRQSLADDANRPRYIETIRNKGYRLIPLVETVPAHEAVGTRRHRWPIAVAAVLLLGIGITGAASYWLAGEPRAPASPSSVAVLPFENLTPDPDDAYFAAGMQDEIVSQLTKLRALSVIPVRPGDGPGESISEVVRGLNVATVLGGRVIYAEGHVRVTTYLTEVATGKSRWSDSYDHELKDIFRIQSEIALEVARALSVELSEAERERIERVPTIDPRARDLYLVARARDPYSLREGTTAIGEVEEALALDPAFIEALVLDAHLRCAAAQITDPERLDVHLPLAEQAARRAIELDPELGGAYAALGTVLQAKEDWTGAEAAFRQAMNLNVPAAEMGGYALQQLYAGKFTPFALDILEEARAAAPQKETMHRFLAFIHAGRGEWAKADELYQLGLRRFEGDDATVSRMLNQRMHWLVGRNELEKARAIPIADPLNTAMLASRDPQQALAKLRRAYEATVPGDPNQRRDIGLWAGHYGDSKFAFEAMRAATGSGLS